MMSAKSLKTAIPSPEARENVFGVMRSTAAPVTAKALAKLLVVPQRIAVAALVPILDEFVAAGRLYRIPPATARGQPLYWDRDAAAMLRAAVLAAVQAAVAPVTARELVPRMELPFKPGASEVAAVLSSLGLTDS